MMVEEQGSSEELQLGCYRIRISQMRNTLLSSTLRKYLICAEDVSPDLHLLLKTVEFQDVDGCREGWSSSKHREMSTASYCSAGRMIFQIIYGENSTPIEVHTESLHPKAQQLGIQFAILLGLARSGVGLHGVTVIVDNQVVILVAPSGTGKTTLAQLLCRCCEAAIVNGDFALLSIADSYVVYEPTPFCGTSKICHNQRLLINRIVFLEQSNENHWKDLSIREAFPRLLSNVFIPEWDEDKRILIIDNLVRIIELVPMSVFAFAPEEEAAHVFFSNVTK